MGAWAKCQRSLSGINDYIPALIFIFKLKSTDRIDRGYLEPKITTEYFRLERRICHIVARVYISGLRFSLDEFYPVLCAGTTKTRHFEINEPSVRRISSHF